MIPAHEPKIEDQASARMVVYKVNFSILPNVDRKVYVSKLPTCKFTCNLYGDCEMAPWCLRETHFLYFYVESRL